MGKAQTKNYFFIGADHGGFELKEKLKAFFRKNKVEFEDIGGYVYDPEDDYPDYATLVAKKVALGSGRGILICRSGAGVALVANKYPNVRAVNIHSAKEAQAARSDEDANLLCLGADFITSDQAKKIVQTWMRTKASQHARHKRRRKKIEAIERTLQ